MNKFETTKTYKNLWSAFAGESQARNKYTFFASIAQKEGFYKISDTFLELANNEKEHAKVWFKLINNGKTNSTLENLHNSIKNENNEWTKMYKQYAIDAKKDGYKKIEALFLNIAKIEENHEKILKDLLKKIKIYKNKINKSNKWKCSKCGQLKTKNKPVVCDVCEHKNSFNKSY